MSLKSKVLILVLACVAVYAVADAAIEHWIVRPSFASLEQEEAGKDLQRCVEAIRREVHHLDRDLCVDWASWDDMYRFLDDRNEAFVAGNLTDSMLTQLDLDMVMILDTDGHKVWGRFKNQTAGVPRTIDEFEGSSLPAGHPLLAQSGGAAAADQPFTRGLYRTEHAPLLVASRPVLTSEGVGPSRGTVIMGRFLDEPFTEMLSDQTRVQLHAWPIRDGDAPSEASRVLARLTSAAPVAYEPNHDGTTLQAYAAMNDIQGARALLLRADLPRDITAQGRLVMTYDRWITIGVLVLLAGSLLFSLQRMIVAPILELTKHTNTVARQGDLEARVDMDRIDEIGMLANQFDRMLGQLRDTQDKAVDDSYYSGMAALTTKALGAIDQALDPVMDQLGELRGDIDKMPLDRIEETRSRLASEKESPVRVEDLCDMLAEVNEVLTAITEDTTTRIDDLLDRTSQLDMILSDPRYFKRK